MGKIVTTKKTDACDIILKCDEEKVFLLKEEISYQVLFENSTFEDGTPCGKLVE